MNVVAGRQPMGNRPSSAEYRQLVEKAQQSHEQGRRTDTIEATEVDLARLYAYAFRIHTIGSFYATGEALKFHLAENELTRAHLQRAIEQLEDLANQVMEPVPDDFRAGLSSFYCYHRGVERVVDALSQAQSSSRNHSLSPIAEHFAAAMSGIQSCNGIYLTQDSGAPEQASFVVPNLGITIVLLVYGDHHSWNLAYQRSILIPAAVMDRNGSGGLELAIARANPAGFSYPIDHYRTASVVRGNGILEIGPVACDLRPHDHFGVPAGMTAAMRQVGEEPLVALDALIRTF